MTGKFNIPVLKPGCEGAKIDLESCNFTALSLWPDGKTQFSKPKTLGDAFAEFFGDEKAK